MRVLIVSFAFLVALTSSALAQDAYLELLRSDVKSQRVAIITAAMDFTEEEGAAFWPLYREYQVEMDKLGDQRIQFLKDFAAIWTSVTNEQAQDLAKRSFKMQEDKIKLKKKYFGKFEKAITASRAAKFLQLENQIDLLIDMQIASEMPLLQEAVEDIRTEEPQKDSRRRQ